MIVSKHFVYLHLEKTGGSWVRSVLSGFTPWEWDLWIRGSYHQGWKDIPREHAGKQVLLTLRNPWDWYVSHYLYYHQRRMPLQNEVPQLEWNPKLREFHEKCSGTFEQALPFLLRSDHNYAVRRQRVVPPNYRRTRVLEFSRLSEDLEKQLTQLCGELSPELLYRIRNHRRVNETQRERGYREWYSTKMRQRVAEVEAGVINKQRYAF